MTQNENDLVELVLRMYVDEDLGDDQVEDVNDGIMQAADRVAKERRPKQFITRANGLRSTTDQGIAL